MSSLTYENTLSQVQYLSSMNFHVKALIFGPPGGGKTVTAATCPRPLHLDTDGTGALSLFNHPEIAYKTKRLQIRQFNQMWDIFEAYQAGDPRVADCDTIIIDTFDALVKRHLDEFIDSEKLLHPNREPVPYQRDYRYNTDAMRKVGTYFQELPCNLAVLCHVESVKDDRTGFVTLKPYLTPRLLSAMEQSFDVFGYMTANMQNDGTVVRQLQLMPTAQIWAKCRIGGLPPILAEPTFQNLIDAKDIMMYKMQEYLSAVAQAQTTGTPEPERPDGIILPDETTETFVPIQVGGAYTPGKDSA